MTTRLRLPQTGPKPADLGQSNMEMPAWSIQQPASHYQDSMFLG